MDKPHHKVSNLKPSVPMVQAPAAPRPLGVGWQDDRRLSRHQRGYGTEWDKLSRQVQKEANYICQCKRCELDGVVRPSHATDHITPKFEGGTDARENLQAINRECHKIKTAEEALRARALGVSIGGGSKP